MAKKKTELHIEYADVGDLLPYEGNARAHSDEDVTAIVESIKEFGFNDPIGVWKKTIVEGHGRLQAAQRLGMKQVPIIHLDHLTDEQRRAYALAHNKTAELSGWDFNILEAELIELADMDMSLFGFNGQSIETDWFQDRERFDTSREEGNEEYNEFLEKFETKKTSDDCYTPDIVYDALVEWVENEYNVKRENFVRPFYPGGDYQAEEYPEDCIVVDNPPFSILSEILNYYADNGIKFFLFAPALTLFSSSSSSSCALPLNVGVTYENGATVSTSFLTNLEDHRVRCAPDLYQTIKAANEENLKQQRKEIPKYSYPDEVLTASKAGYFSAHDTALTIERKDSKLIRRLDSQKEYDNSVIYGSGYLLSEKAAAEKAAAEKAAAEKAAAEKAAAEKAAAEKAAAHRWQLSEREKEIVRSLGGES